MEAKKIILQLHDSGFHVIPSGRGKSGKQPLASWKKYQEQQPTKEELGRWLDSLKPTKWGIVTNEHVAVIDADTLEARAKLEGMIGQPNVATPRGGAHWYVDTTGHPLKTRTGCMVGVDVRGVGGFVNIVGEGYKILTLPAHDTLISYEALPDEIKEALEGGSKSDTAAAEAGATIPEGERNSHLTSLAGTMRKRGMTQASIEVALLEENRLQCNPPLPDAEVKSIAKSVARYEPQPITYTKPVGLLATDLMEKYFNDLQFALPGILAEGFAILAGKPKSGKSWFALQAAYSVALGKNLLNDTPCDRGRALYLALEDGERRMQDRISKIDSSGCILNQAVRTPSGGMRIRMLMGEDIPARLHLFFKWPKLGEGCIEEIDKFIDEHPDTRLIVIDIIKRIIKKKGKGPAYDEDYEAIQPLQELATKRRVAILGIHHTRKATSDDPFETVSGTFGLTGGADSILILKRENDDEFRLSITGRDVEARELAMKFDSDCVWKLLGDADEHFVSEERMRILDAIRKTPKAPKQISEEIDATRESVRRMMRKMLRDGLVRENAKGEYSATEAKRAAHTNIGNRVTPHIDCLGISVAPRLRVHR